MAGLVMKVACMALLCVALVAAPMAEAAGTYSHVTTSLSQNAKNLHGQCNANSDNHDSHSLYCESKADESDDGDDENQWKLGFN